LVDGTIKKKEKEKREKNCKKSKELEEKRAIVCTEKFKWV
jgi:hypothetical protein